MKVEWHGNASFSVTSGTLSILFDPFVELPGGENPNCPEDFSGYRNIFLTHGHMDHLGNLPEILAASDAAGGRARVFCTETPCETLCNKGVRDGRIRVVKGGDVLHFYEDRFTHARMRGASSETCNKYVQKGSASSEDCYKYAKKRGDFSEEHSAQAQKKEDSFEEYSAQAQKKEDSFEEYSAQVLQSSELSKDRCCFAPSICVTVLTGQHVRFDRKLLLDTFLTPHLFSNPRNLLWITREFILDPENGETVAYKIEAEGKTILMLGSLGLRPDETYPSPVDAFILPYQGSSDLVALGLAAVDAVKPGVVILSHFDDAFPPISRSIDPAGFIEAMGKTHPDTPVIVPHVRTPFSL